MLYSTKPLKSRQYSPTFVIIPVFANSTIFIIIHSYSPIFVNNYQYPPLFARVFQLNSDEYLRMFVNIAEET